jgi:hypothetical protein
MEFKAFALINADTKKVEMLDVYRKDNLEYESQLINFCVSIAKARKYEPVFEIKTFEWDEKSVPIFDFVEVGEPEYFRVEKVASIDDPLYADNIMRYRLPPVLTGQDQDCGCGKTITVKEDGVVEVNYAPS